MTERDPRFDNVPTADLVAREFETRMEAKALYQAVRDRLVAEAMERLVIGAVYRIKKHPALALGEHRLDGRLMKLEGVKAGADVHWDKPFKVLAWGRLNGKSAAGDGWTIKRQDVLVERLERVE